VSKLNQYPVLIIPALIALVSFIFQVADLVPQFRYDRSLVEQGQWWLFITGNLVHLGWGHLVLNLAGLAMVWWFFIDDLSVWEWLLALLVSGLFVTLGLYFFDPYLIWYVGLSGLLHGLFVAGGVRLLGKEFGFALVLLVVLAGKLAYEQFFGSLPGTSEMSGGPVVVNAHLYGAIGGVVSGILMAWIMHFLTKE
jgi:rhomboid family GlyGly-CTERM serine protease